MEDQLNKAWKERCETFKKARECFAEVKRTNERIAKLNMDDHYPEIVDLSDHGLVSFNLGQEYRDQGSLQWEAAVTAAGHRIMFWQKPEIKGADWICILDDGREFRP